jgi:hypothetical protein
MASFTPFLVPYIVASQSTCQSRYHSSNSKCTGCPPTFEGKPCATTTAYGDLTKGACGCGAPPDNREIDKSACQSWDLSSHPTCDINANCADAGLWQFVNYTAALNAANFMPSNPSGAGWAGNSQPSEHACGQCYRICSTGGQACEAGNPQYDCPSTSPTAGECIVAKISNSCTDGYANPSGDNPWCGQQLSHKACAGTDCQSEFSTNQWGYAAHFDLMDRWCQLAPLGWTDGSNILNAEVTWEAVDCAEYQGQQSYQCQVEDSSAVSFDDLSQAKATSV